MTSSDVAKILNGLASETRVDVFRKLLAHARSGMSVGEIQAAMDIPASTLAFHLGELVEAGLIDQERSGRMNICRPRIEVLRTILEVLNRECCSAET